jgi:hypothetical protein
MGAFIGKFYVEWAEGVIYRQARGAAIVSTAVMSPTLDRFPAKRGCKRTTRPIRCLGAIIH